MIKKPLNIRSEYEFDIKTIKFIANYYEEPINFINYTKQFLDTKDHTKGSNTAWEIKNLHNYLTFLDIYDVLEKEETLQQIISIINSVYGKGPKVNFYEVFNPNKIINWLAIQLKTNMYTKQYIYY